MPRRPAWNGAPPAGPADARRRLIEAARLSVERYGARAGLKDVAEAAGVTRQTVYRYFESTDDLFRSAAALASGGFLERMRRQVRTRPTLGERVAECLVFAIRHLPEEPQLEALTMASEHFGVETALALGFVQDEIRALADGETGLSARQRDELTEILVRLLQSFLLDPARPRTEAELRRFLTGWLAPAIEAHLERRGVSQRART